MADSPDDCLDLLRRWREGSQEAASELFARYEAHMLRAARRVLGSRPRASHLDLADITQLAWRSFFRTLPVHDIDTAEKLAALLATMARNKALKEQRRSAAKKRDTRREVPLDRLPGGGVELPDPEPSLTDMAICREQWDHLLENHPEQHRQIVELHSAGRSCAEIGRIMGLAEASVRRILRRLVEEFAALMSGVGQEDGQSATPNRIHGFRTRSSPSSSGAPARGSACRSTNPKRQPGREGDR